MMFARSQLIDTSVTRWYHCVSRCVRRAFLLGEEPRGRQAWIENRLEELGRGLRGRGLLVMETDLHLLLRVDSHLANA